MEHVWKVFISVALRCTTMYIKVKVLGTLAKHSLAEQRSLSEQRLFSVPNTGIALGMEGTGRQFCFRGAV